VGYLAEGRVPCHDYSVAKSASHAHGMEGKKGVLWWQIERLLRHPRPTFVLLNSADRLPNSPATRRGCDFAIILARRAALPP
jgi:DNA (cytosine-5)-methyltransferase 1